MGKGTGDHIPQKFVNDQYFCQFFMFLFMSGSLVLSTFSAGMDDGGSFPYPYFFTGFVLAPILLVNLISRWCVVRAVQKKGVTRNNIVDTLNKTRMGKWLWPWSCRVGLVWCIPALMLIGLGGINCKKGQENETSSNSTLKNNCYYDITGDQGDRYRGCAIGLLVIHIGSFVYLLLSNCPASTVLDQIKADPPKRNTPAVAPSAPPAPAPAPAAAAAPAAQAPKPTANKAANKSDVDKEMKSKIQQLEARVRELESREREMIAVNVIPAPPTYNESMNSELYKSAGANPV